MKRITLFIITILLLGSAYTTFAQTRSLHEALRELGDGATFVPVTINITASNTNVVATNDRYEMRLVNNQYDRLNSFNFTKQGEDKLIINAGFGVNSSGEPYLKPNHYTEPSLVSHGYTGLAYVFADGMLYRLKKVDNFENPSSWKIDYVYVPTGKVSNGKAFKIGFKSKIDGFKVQAKVEKKDHNAVLKAYFAEMKAIQEEATANFSPEILAEINGMGLAEVAHQKSVNDANAAYWNSAEGQRKLGEMRGKTDGEDRITIINEGSDRFYLMTERGTTYWIGRGESWTHKCSDDLYYAHEDGSGNHNVKGALLYSADSDCGGTIRVQ